MTAAGLGLNKFCYAGLIVALRNKTPIPDDFTAKVVIIIDISSWFNMHLCRSFPVIFKLIILCEKVIEFVERSKMWSSVETNSANAENVMMGVSDEELYNLPTAEYVHRRGAFLVRAFAAYHTAFYAAADLKNVEVWTIISVGILVLLLDGSCDASYLFF